MAQRKSAPTKAATKPAPAPEPEVDELDAVDELDEIEEVEAPKPAKKAAAKGKAAAKPAADKPSFGTSELAAHISEETGKSYDNKAVRVLLRKLANDGVLKRTIGEDRSRYSFTGPDDPQVKAIVKAVNDGAVEKERSEKLAALKAKKAADKAKADAEAEPVAEAEDVEDDDISELEDDE